MGMLRMSGVPLRGRALLAAFGRSRSPCRSSPSRVTIADTEEKEGVPPPSPEKPHGERQGRRTVPPNSPNAKRALRAAAVSDPPDEIGSPARQPPRRCFPRAALPPTHPRLAAWQAVWRGQPPSRIQGAIPYEN